MANNIIWNVDDSYSSANLADNTNLASATTGTVANCQVASSDVVIDNTSNLDTHMAVRISLGAAAWTVTGYWELYLADALDGSTYPTAGSYLLPPTFMWRQCQISTATTNQALVLPTLINIIPPWKFKMQWRNQSGVTLNASGNSISYRRFRLTDNG
jgi:hypothetical protein